MLIPLTLCIPLIPFNPSPCLRVSVVKESAMRKLQFYYFHLMPWPYLPEDFETRYESAWVTLPNALYDPERGHALYHRYLDELVAAERWGWDGICVNEHHQNAYGTMPSPNI